MAACLTVTRGDKTELIAEKIDHTKICQILKHTYLCLVPMTKMFAKVVELLRKSQVGIYMEKGNGKKSKMHPMTPSQIVVLDECYNICMEYEKMDLNRDTFFGYLCTGRIPDSTFFSKKYIPNNKDNKKEKKRNGKNKKSQPTVVPTPPPLEDPSVLGDDPAKAFLQWKNKTQKMFTIYEHLTSKRKEVEEIIKHVDPTKKTCLMTLFKSKECDRCQKIVEDLTENLTRVDLSTICTCGCFQSIVPKKMCVTDSDGKCRCGLCGREMEFEENSADSIILPSSSTTTKMKITTTITESGKVETREEIVQSLDDSLSSGDQKIESGGSEGGHCEVYLRMKGEDPSSVLDLLSKHKVEWDYSSVKVDYETMNVSMTKACGLSSDPNFKETVQSLLSGMTSGSNNDNCSNNGQGDFVLSPKRRSVKITSSSVSTSTQGGGKGKETNIEAILTVRVAQQLKQSLENLGIGMITGIEIKKNNDEFNNNFNFKGSALPTVSTLSTPAESTLPNLNVSSGKVPGVKMTTADESADLSDDDLWDDDEFYKEIALSTSVSWAQFFNPVSTNKVNDEEEKRVVFVKDKSSQTEGDFDQTFFQSLLEGEQEVELDGKEPSLQKRKIKIKMT